jgi:uncharacterized protein YjcR
MTYSVEIINYVINSLINKIKIINISKKYNIAINTIYKWKFLYCHF